MQGTVPIQAPVAGLGLELGNLKANIYLLIAPAALLAQPLQSPSAPAAATGTVP
jgi:hypothetical protein